MSDDLDPGLRRLFAETADDPADEAFVSAVSARTARTPSLSPALLSMATGGLTALALAAAVGALGLALRQSALAITPLVGSTPLGVATGLAFVFAGAVCVRLLGPFAARRL